MKIEERKQRKVKEINERKSLRKLFSPITCSLFQKRKKETAIG